MKKILNRIRCWLIKKLGGYTEQFTPVHQQFVWSENVKPQKIQAHISVPMPGPGSAIDFKRYCERHVLDVLVRELHQSGFILWETENELPTGRVNVWATLRVVNANDLEPYIKYGVK